jgi:prophage antirepressor-like protein
MGKRHSLSSVSPPRKFTFHRKQLRVFPHEQGPRFVAADIAKLLKYRDETALQTALGKKAGCLLTPASGPALLTLSEAELRDVLRTCGKPQALQLQGWLDDTLLPILRKGTHADQDKLQLAYALAGEAARQVGQAVWESVLAGEADWQQSRWLVSLHYQAEQGQRRPSGKTVALQAEVSTLAALAECVAEAGTLPVNNRELIKLAAACHLRLAERMQKQALRV